MDAQPRGLEGHRERKDGQPGAVHEVLGQLPQAQRRPRPRSPGRDRDGERVGVRPGQLDAPGGAHNGAASPTGTAPPNPIQPHRKGETHAQRNRDHDDLAGQPQRTAQAQAHDQGAGGRDPRARSQRETSRTTTTFSPPPSFSAPTATGPGTSPSGTPRPGCASASSRGSRRSLATSPSTSWRRRPCSAASPPWSATCTGSR